MELRLSYTNPSKCSEYFQTSGQCLCIDMLWRHFNFVVAGGIAGCQNDSLWCRRWWQGGIVAAVCLPVPKWSPGNTLHVLSQNTWQYNTKFRWSMWSYSSIIIDDGGSSIWRLGCRWWHPGLSLWQLMLPPVAAGLTGWRPSIFGDGIGSRYITMYMCVCHYICKCIPCKSIE